MEKEKYEYPVGDFLSGFSKDETNPCDYELECQRMVIRGVEYLDENPKIFDLIALGGITIGSPEIKPMITYMCSNEDNPGETDGQTGAMVSHTVKSAYAAKKMGWKTYIEKITEK